MSKTHRYELSPLLAEGRLSLIGSEHASRIRLPDGLNLSRAVTTSAILTGAILSLLATIFITLGGPPGHGYSLTVAAQ